MPDTHMVKFEVRLLRKSFDFYIPVVEDRIQSVTAEVYAVMSRVAGFVRMEVTDEGGGHAEELEHLEARNEERDRMRG